MSYEKFKLTDDAISQNGVSAAPDKLLGSAQENKKIFDRLIRNVVKELLNGLVDQLGTDNEALNAITQRLDEGDGGISEETAGMLEIDEESTVNAALQRLYDIAVLGGIPSTEKIAVSKGTADAYKLKDDATADAVLRLLSAHASRHAKDGADPITLDMMGAAPSGFGLGDKAKRLTAENDLNNVRTTGWYCFHRNNQPANVPEPTVYSAVMEVIFGYSSEQTMQRVYSTGDANDWNLTAQRVYYGSIWQPWEWVNPPMKLGVEYRTTERYNGKPVYVQRVDFGALPNNTIKIITFGDSTVKMISASAVMSGGYVIPGATGSSDFPSHVLEILTADGGQVGIITHIDRSSNTAVVVAKYWKTTD